MKSRNHAHQGSDSHPARRDVESTRNSKKEDVGEITHWLLIPVILYGKYHNSPTYR
jgi:hypothetical protein